MQLVIFTKAWAPLTVEALADVAEKIGVTGFDLAVRPGNPVNPENAEVELPRAVETWRKRGLDVPLVSLPTETTDPESPAVRRVFAACGAAGVPRIKLGYWFWKGSTDFAAEAERIRATLRNVEALAAEHRVCALVHNHSGNLYPQHALMARRFVEGLDPDRVGIYLDPAHLALCGEPIGMALDVVGEYLRMVAVKSPRYVRAEGKWRREFCELAEGLVDWPAALAALRAAGYDGPLSMHAEYSHAHAGDAALPLVMRDAELIRRALGA